MADIATALAADFLAGAGWCCIIVAPQTVSAKVLRPPATTVTIEGVSARHEPGIRIWFGKRRDADKTVASFLSRDQRARRRPRGDGLLVDASVGVVDHAIRAVAFSLGFALVGDDFIDEQMALIARRIETAMARMQRDGSMKKINQEYAAARDAARTSGTPHPPRFDIWLTAKLRPAIQAGL